MREMPVVMARRDGTLVGYLVANFREYALGQPLTKAKFAAYPAAADA